MKRIIIIGATSGIGEEFCRQYIIEGNIIGAIGRNRQKLKSMQDEYGVSFIPQTLDISDTASIKGTLNKLAERTGGIDLLIISSSISNKNPDLDWESEKEVLDINVIGYSAVLNFAVQYFKKQGFGHIAGISSVAKFFGNKNPAYNATKAYESIYLEGIRFNLDNYPEIFVTDIRPGFVDTPLVAGRTEMYWLVPVEKAVRQMRSAIRKQKRQVYISKRWQLLALILPWFPYRIKRKLIV